MDQDDRYESSNWLEKLEHDIAEAQTRNQERFPPPPENPPDTEMIDRAGRSITIRSWESGQQLYVRAYDTDQVQVPESVNLGQAGSANASVERGLDGTSCRVRLHYIETHEDYQKAGIATEMMDKVVQFGYKQGASEIYGAITDAEARNFWLKQADHGWSVVQHGSGYEVHKKLNT